MKFGLFLINSAKQPDWLRECNNEISIWPTAEEADEWRRKYTVEPKKYTVKKVTLKTIREDQGLIDGL